LAIKFTKDGEGEADRMKKKKLPIGYSDLKEIINKSFYFVDKSLMIKDLIESTAKATLITRPRRFGKTLNMSMVRRYFEDERDYEGNKTDNSYLFDGLKITCDKDFESKYKAHMGAYPVIDLTLNMAKQSTYELSYYQIKQQICSEFKRHRYVLNSKAMMKDDYDTYSSIMYGNDDEKLYTAAIGFLSKCLFDYHKSPVIVLVDEYDVPLQNAYFEGFYTKMVEFIRSLFESGFKTNPYLHFGLITGCLRISKESIFTGMNHLSVCSVLSQGYAPYYGFTDEEIQDILKYNDIEKEYDELKSWYDGYLFGKTEIYNPWSMVMYINDRISENVAYPVPYWVNTSGNDIIKNLVETAERTDDDYSELREDLETLMNGGSIEKIAHDESTYEDMYNFDGNIWNFLMHTGYLKPCGRRYTGSETYVSMTVPNKEVACVYRWSIIHWFEKRIRSLDKKPLIKALEEGDCDGIADFISDQLARTISYLDYAENFYHGFMGGLLVGLPGYSVDSNRENGRGRTDIVLTERRFRGKAIILEFKTAKKIKEMPSRCQEALKQIEDRDYASSLEDRGYHPILKYGVCFLEKGCMVMKE